MKYYLILLAGFIFGWAMCAIFTVGKMADEDNG